jgi:hypothetical protein
MNIQYMNKQLLIDGTIDYVLHFSVIGITSSQTVQLYIA